MVVRRLARAAGLVGLDSLAVLAATVMVSAYNGASIGSQYPLLLVTAIAGLAAVHAYGPAGQRRSGERLAFAVAFALVATGALDAAYHEVDWTLSEYLIFSVPAWLALFLGRNAADRLVGMAYERKVAVERVLVVGRWEDEQELREHFRNARERGMEVVGFVEGRDAGDARAMGTAASLSEVVEHQDIDRVVISADLPADRLQEIVGGCFLHGVGVSVVPATLTELECKVSGRSLLGWPMLELEVPRLHLVQVITKRTVDILVSSLALLLLAPLLIGISIAVKVDSPGPIFFRQRRLGVGGRHFTILKFRSMRADAEEILRATPHLYERYLANGFKLSPEEDPRVSRLGSFLRASSLDELPQLFNVLVGDMSLVGPRPIVPAEIKEYGVHAPTFLGVRPGLTGFWQISGRSAVGYPQRAELDIDYIRSWSFALDVKILLLTLPAVVWRRGAF